MCDGQEVAWSELCYKTIDNDSKIISDPDPLNDKALTLVGRSPWEHAASQPVKLAVRDTEMRLSRRVETHARLEKGKVTLHVQDRATPLVEGSTFVQA